MAIDKDAIKNAAARGASMPLISDILSRFGIGKKDAEAAAQEIVGGGDIDTVIDTLPPPRSIGGGLSIPMMLGVFGIGIVAIIMMTKKGGGKKKKK